MAEHRLLRVLGRPGLFFIYGRPLSYKTAFSLWVASSFEGYRVYAAAGKHALVRVPPGLKKTLLLEIKDAVKFSLSLVGGPPETLVLDGVEALLAPLRGISSSRTQLQLLLLLLEPILYASRQGCRCLVTLEGGEKPHYYSVAKRMASLFVRTSVGEDALSVELRDTGLRVLRRYSLPIHMLSGIYGDKG